MTEKTPHPADTQVKLVLDGTTLTLVYDFQALAVFKHLTDINMLSSFNAAEWGADTVATFLMAGALRVHGEAYGLDWCLKALRPDNYVESLRTMLRAFRGSIPEPKNENPPQPIAEKS